MPSKTGRSHALITKVHLHVLTQSTVYRKFLGTIFSKSASGRRGWQGVGENGEGDGCGRMERKGGGGGGVVNLGGVLV